MSEGGHVGSDARNESSAHCTLRSGVQKGKGDAFAEMLLGFDLGFCATADIMIRREANTRDWYTLADIPLYYFQTIFAAILKWKC